MCEALHVTRLEKEEKKTSLVLNGFWNIERKKGRKEGFEGWRCWDVGLRR